MQPWLTFMGLKSREQCSAISQDIGFFVLRAKINQCSRASDRETMQPQQQSAKTNQITQEPATVDEASRAPFSGLTNLEQHFWSGSPIQPALACWQWSNKSCMPQIAFFVELAIKMQRGYHANRNRKPKDNNWEIIIQNRNWGALSYRISLGHV